MADALRRLLHDADSSVADMALLFGKGTLTSKEIAPFLETENIDLRRTAVYALGGAPDARAQNLIDVASRDEDAHCRLNAVQALSRFNDPAAITPLQDLLMRETDTLVRKNILRVVQVINKPSPKPSAEKAEPRRWWSPFGLG